jgi:restriction system protein
MTPTNSFTHLLEARRSDRFGLCMYVPAIMAPTANRLLNAAYGDIGDNLSVPMGTSKGRAQIRYWAGNFSGANFDQTKDTIAALENVPGAVILITEAGVGASASATFGLFENGRTRQFEGVRHSFYSFSGEHLDVERIEHPSEEIEEFQDFGITLQSQMLSESSNAQLLLRTPWEAIFQKIVQNPNSLFHFKDDPRAFEEFIADTYRLDGYDVELTPRSNDGGVDVIASKSGFGAIKIFDQAKAYSEGRRVPANDVRAAYGVLSMAQDTSKVVITTTSEFAPGVYDEFARFMPTRLQLRHGQNLIEWLKHVDANLRRL